MKKNLLTLALVAVALVGVTGCGDDDPVTPGTTTFAFKANQKFTYESTPRDMNNTPETSGMHLVTWTVLETGLTYKTRTNVSRILETRFADDNITVEDTSTVYVSTTTDGEFHQYNLVGSVVGRIPAAASIVDSIPKVWTKIGDTKTTASASFVATPTKTDDVQTPLFPGTAISVTSGIRGQYNGRDTVVVPNKTYNNAFSSDLNISLRAVAFGQQLTNDSLRMSVALDATDGIVMQSLESKTINFKVPPTLTEQPQPIPGYDMKLKAVVQP